MAQNTTNHRAGPRAPAGARALGWALATGLLACALLACTSAQERTSPTNIVGALRFRNARAAELFANTHRAGNLYQDFRPVLVVDAVPMDLQYRRLYLATLQEHYLLPDAELAPLKAESDKEFDNGIDMIVLVYGGTNDPVPLEKPNAVWRILLRDDDGEVLAPSKTEKIRTDSTVYQYINQYFYGLDRWSQLFRVRFPKLEKSLVGKKVGPNAVQLLVTGVSGTVVLSWADTSIFYRPVTQSAARP
jgi:hypothetical protein